MADRDLGLCLSASLRSGKTAQAKSSIKGRNLPKRFEATCKRRRLLAQVHLTSNGSMRAIASSQMALIPKKGGLPPRQSFHDRPFSIFYCDIGLERARR